MVEVVGTPADGLNAAIYKFEGKDFEAKMSAAAMLPGGIAATTAKYAKGLKLGDKLVDGAKILTKNADEVAEGAVKAEKVLDGAAGTGKVGLYSHLKDSKSVGSGKKFTAVQKKNIIKANKKNNGGIVKSDLSSEVLVKPSKSKKGVTPPPNEWQIDHINPRNKGGSNSYSNAQVLSRKENRQKWDK